MLTQRVAMKTEQVIEHFGSHQAVAEALGISRQAVHMWGEYVPEGRAWQLQVITAGALQVEKRPA